MKNEVIVSLEVEDGAGIPVYGTVEAAGADVRAFIESNIILEPGKSTLVPTGIKMEIPKGYEVQVRPRSGLALKYGITVLNTPGTIDSDYRGPVGVILINHSNSPFTIEPNMRIAQLILAPVVKAVYLKKEKLSQTLRNEGGFGHTGLA